MTRPGPELPQVTRPELCNQDVPLDTSLRAPRSNADRHWVHSGDWVTVTSPPPPSTCGVFATPEQVSPLPSGLSPFLRQLPALRLSLQLCIFSRFPHGAVCLTLVCHQRTSDGQKLLPLVLPRVNPFHGVSLQTNNFTGQEGSVPSGLSTNRVL